MSSLVALPVLPAATFFRVPSSILGDLSSDLSSEIVLPIEPDPMRGSPYVHISVIYAASVSLPRQNDLGGAF
jgi:hypothetical protein